MICPVSVELEKTLNRPFSSENEWNTFFFFFFFFFFFVDELLKILTTSNNILLFLSCRLIEMTFYNSTNKYPVEKSSA